MGSCISLGTVTQCKNPAFMGLLPEKGWSFGECFKGGNSQKLQALAMTVGLLVCVSSQVGITLGPQGISNYFVLQAQQWSCPDAEKVIMRS